MMKTTKVEKTPLWQASVNTAAIALIVAGVGMLLTQEVFGVALIGVGLGMEWLKYSKRFN